MPEWKRRKNRQMQIVLDDFSERHHLTSIGLVKREAVAIQSLSTANMIVNIAYSQLDDVALTDPAVGLLLNLLHRNFEHAEASIVAFVTGCGSSAEIIARASVKSSVNIMYILAGDRTVRMLGYFNHYLEDVERQVERWRREVGQLKGREAELHQRGIVRRSKASEPTPSSAPAPPRFSGIGTKPLQRCCADRARLDAAVITRGREPGQNLRPPFAPCNSLTARGGQTGPKGAT